jgi:hypothetical protein
MRHDVTVIGQRWLHYRSVTDEAEQGGKTESRKSVREKWISRRIVEFEVLLLLASVVRSLMRVGHLTNSLLEHQRMSTQHHTHECQSAERRWLRARFLLAG